MTEKESDFKKRLDDRLAAGLADKLRSVGLEQLRHQGHWTALDSVAWDALGEGLVIQFRAGKPGGPDYPQAWVLRRKEASALHDLLERALEEKGTGELPRQ
ncbi:MAG: hypothetical protein JZU58_28600 [Curvibacter lanceolatus]|uniref:hypothetical protein n=1 Tax=Curvibacter lanceolatus TaxID=86182 RepID=UPI002356DA36|nr:hypothetical protein [Curvibacter lanceolatus]MBV5296319.1 hypothetical protein [Curvibacter lanceolatus]